MKNNKQNKQENKQKKTNGIFVKVMAWILCILMVVSMAYFSIIFIVDQIKHGKEEDGHQHAAVIEQYKENI